MIQPFDLTRGVAVGMNIGLVIMARKALAYDSLYHNAYHNEINVFCLVSFVWNMNSEIPLPIPRYFAIPLPNTVPTLKILITETDSKYRNRLNRLSSSLNPLCFSWTTFFRSGFKRTALMYSSPDDRLMFWWKRHKKSRPYPQIYLLKRGWYTINGNSLYLCGNSEEKVPPGYLSL